MVATTAAKKTTAAAPATPAKAAEPVAAAKKATTATATAPKAAAPAPAPAKKEEKPVAAAPVAAAATTAPATETPVAEEPSALIALEAKLAAIGVALKEAIVELKAVKKENERMRKVVERAESKRAKARSNPNGFAKPAPITSELCDFLSVPYGTLISRTDVTRKINAYIKEHNLNNPDNKRIIQPDAKLRAILGTGVNETVSYFQLQKYISRSFVKK